MEKEIRRFRAKTAEGKLYIIIEYEEQGGRGTLESPGRGRAGSTRLATATGLAVVPVSEGKFQIVDIGETVWKI